MLKKTQVLAWFDRGPCYYGACDDFPRTETYALRLLRISQGLCGVQIFPQQFGGCCGCQRWNEISFQAKSPSTWTPGMALATQKSSILYDVWGWRLDRKIKTTCWKKPPSPYVKTDVVPLHFAKLCEIQRHGASVRLAEKNILKWEPSSHHMIWRVFLKTFVSKHMSVLTCQTHTHKHHKAPATQNAHAPNPNLHCLSVPLCKLKVLSSIFPADCLCHLCFFDGHDEPCGSGAMPKMLQNQHRTLNLPLLFN